MNARKTTQRTLQPSGKECESHQTAAAAAAATTTTTTATTATTATATTTTTTTTNHNNQPQQQPTTTTTTTHHPSRYKSGDHDALEYVLRIERLAASSACPADVHTAFLRVLAARDFFRSP